MNKVPNYTKQAQYRNTVTKLNRAITGEFCYEAIMLDYALIEDRLNEFLLSLGVINMFENGPKVTAQSKKAVRELLHLGPGSHFDIKNISKKLYIMRNLINYSGENPYLQDLHNLLEKRIGKEEIICLIEDIESWIAKRNTYTHGLLNLVPLECDAETKELAIAGKELFRRTDCFCRRVKKSGIRKKYRIQPLL